nr:hypothetical protein [Tanacetum cinerariifolium]
MSGELGLVKSDVGKLCLERNELDEKFEEVSRVLAGLSAKERVSVVIMETDALRKEGARMIECENLSPQQPPRRHTQESL